MAITIVHEVMMLAQLRIGGAPDAGIGSGRAYWVSVLATGDAGQQDPNSFCLSFDPDADILVEGKTPDFSVSIADSEPIVVPVASGPLAVTLGDFLADENSDTVDFVWQPASEQGVAGFHLYAAGGAAPLNGTLIASPVIDSVTPTTYRFSASTDAAVFYLDELGIDGSSRRHGPFGLGQVYGAYVAESNEADEMQSIYLPVVVK